MQVPKGSAYTQLAWSRDDVLAAACGTRIDFLDPKTGQCLDSIDNAHDSTITTLEWSPKLFETGMPEQHAACVGCRQMSTDDDELSLCVLPAVDAKPLVLICSQVGTGVQCWQAQQMTPKSDCGKAPCTERVITATVLVWR